MTNWTSQWFLGADPGASGGLACLDETGAVVLVEKMPESDADLLMTLRLMLPPEPERKTARVFAHVERVSASPQMGVSSAFAFGGSYRALRMALAALEVPYDLVAPTVWQTAMRCRTGGGALGQRNQTEAKNITKARAQQLWPNARVTHAIADALLLAEHCRRARLGLLRAAQAKAAGSLHNVGEL